MEGGGRCASVSKDYGQPPLQWSQLVTGFSLPAQWQQHTVGSGSGALHDITKRRIPEMCALSNAYTLKNGT